jgi:hypothetical protein
MTGVSVLLAEVRAAGVQLGLDGGKLRIKVPRGVLTAAQRDLLVEHRAEIAILLTEPAGDRYGPDEVVADLKTVFTVDGPASHAAAERLAKARGADVPVGDDLPAWQAWMNRRYVWRRRRGFSQAEARRIVWGEAEWKWHLRHGSPPDPDRCAGCGMRILNGDGMQLLDGAMVHVSDPDVVECLAIYGAQYRSAAAVGLMALGLMRPQPC